MQMNVTRKDTMLSQIERIKVSKVVRPDD